MRRIEGGSRTARRGRPPSFDRAEAVAAAMEVFWAKGYEGTTLEELLEAMGGITAPSLYNAFGSKEELFKEAVDLYVLTIAQKSVEALENAPSARVGVESMLRIATTGFSRPGRPRGCMVTTSAAKCARGNEGAEAYVRSLRIKAPDAIKRRLKRALEEGELPASVDTDRMAAFYATVAQGLGVRAGDGVSRAELMAVVDGAMAAWDGLLKAPRTRKKIR